MLIQDVLIMITRYPIYSKKEAKNTAKLVKVAIKFT
jgi:hypothetical protein